MLHEDPIRDYVSNPITDLELCEQNSCVVHSPPDHGTGSVVGIMGQREVGMCWDFDLWKMKLSNQLINRK